jgi:hypothetical protein
VHATSAKALFERSTRETECPLWVTSGRTQPDAGAAHVRFTPKADKRVGVPLSLLSATTGREQVQQTNVRQCGYSITSSASESRLSEILMPSAFAVLRLITVSNLVGCRTGRSTGFAPLRILSTNAAAR